MAINRADVEDESGGSQPTLRDWRS
jgi:hypothetical protein